MKRYSAKTRRLTYAPLKSRLSACLLAPLNQRLHTHDSSAYPTLHKDRRSTFTKPNTATLFPVFHPSTGANGAFPDRIPSIATARRFSPNISPTRLNTHPSPSMHTHSLPGWRNGVFELYTTSSFDGSRGHMSRSFDGTIDCCRVVSGGWIGFCFAEPD